MPRRRSGEPVENEERIAVAALRLSNAGSLNQDGEEPRFWVRDIQDELARLDPSTSVNDSTVNRALNRFVAQGWVWASWETADPDNRLSSRPRLYFRITPEGRQAIRDMIAAKRREIPVWLLYPAEVVGEQVDDPPLPARAGKRNASMFHNARASGRSVSRSAEPLPDDAGSRSRLRSPG